MQYNFAKNFKLLSYMEETGASVVISHNIIAGKQQEYENWLNEIVPLCRNSPGNIDLQIIRPIANLTFTYTVIIRFDTTEHLKDWMGSETRKRLIEKANPLFAREDNYYIKTGLDFLFLNADQNPKAPLRWKQYFVTWSAIYPLSMLIPFIILPLFSRLHLPQNSYLNSFFISGIIVFIMVYFLMPNYTRLLKKWLYK